ncbi:uncharacterized protein [Nicotiana tomentosiformis]|uniref:uncharacterized protein n=1 Tax=Nicotiana tomentosiformis TaxID=4098 RepID=UPI00388C3704
MSNSQSAPVHMGNDFGHHDENDNIAPGNDVPPVGLDRVPAVGPIDASSHAAINANLAVDLESNIRRDVRSTAQSTHGGEEGGISLRVIFEMLQAQQATIAQLQNQNHLPSRIEPEPSQEVAHRFESVSRKSNGNESGADPAIMKMFEELTKRVESAEKKIEANDKKVQTYNSRVDQIPGAPPILKGLDSKKFMQKPFPSSAAPKPIPKKFRMPEIPKCNGTTDPNEHATSYTCATKGNDLEDDEIKSVLLKKFGEILSKGAMIWYHNLSPNSIDSFAMLADSFVKAHAGAIEIETRKSDLFKVRQKDNKMLREFVSRFQMERMDLLPVADDWAIQAFTQGLNVRSLVALQQLKQNLIEYPAVTWGDVHNRYQSKIRVEDD